MNVSYVSSQGQTTIPANIRSTLGIKPGQKLIWSIDHVGGKIPILRVETSTPSVISSLKGSAKGIYGKSKHKIDEYLTTERDSWKTSPSSA